MHFEPFKSAANHPDSVFNSPFFKRLQAAAPPSLFFPSDP
jgi:hypothetical protein